MKTSVVSKFFLAAFTFIFVQAKAQTTCQPVDLRDPVTAPLQDQFFKDDKGVLHESQACQSYVAANLLSQVLKTAVSAEDIFFYGSLMQGLGHREIDGSELAKEHLFFDGGGYPDEFINLNSGRGFCVKADMDEFIRSNGRTDRPLEHFYSEAVQKQSTIAELVSSVGSACKTRVNLSGLKADRQVVKYESKRHLVFAEIDAHLDKGQMVGYGHNNHLVTVVGRTEKCEYIIQDSIPEEQWVKNSTFADIQYQDGQQKIRFEGGFQYWTREALLSNMTSVSYIER